MDPVLMMLLIFLLLDLPYEHLQLISPGLYNVGVPDERFLIPAFLQRRVRCQRYKRLDTLLVYEQFPCVWPCLLVNDPIDDDASDFDPVFWI